LASAAFHRFNGLLFGLALAATVLAHAAANVYNDVGDDLIGADAGNTDRIYPYTGGSRFIQTGLLSRSQMTRLALGLAAAALTLGALLAVLRGPGVILLGVAGLGLGLLYSLPGAQLSARGIGEAAVAIGFGALPVLGSVWLQTGFIDSAAVLLCVPVSAWAAADSDNQRGAGYRGGPSCAQTHACCALGCGRCALDLLGPYLGRLAASDAAVALHALPSGPRLRHWRSRASVCGLLVAYR